MKITKFFRKNPQLVVLGMIILIGIFFRTYQIVERFEFAHDGDLYSWIVKDMVVEGHFRLIGQLTSAKGIFIGPFFYYLLTSFFLLTNMDPIGAVIPITILGILTIISYYFVFSKLFNPNIGLIAAFLDAVLLTHVYFDRAVVPSTPTNLWTIWYFYCVVMLVRGNFSVLPLVGVLIGLIWHIHIALLPTIAVIPLAIMLAKKLPSKKQFLYFLIALLITSLPLLAFEVKHSFSQTKSIINNFSLEHGGGVGLPKLDILSIKFARNVVRLFFLPNLPQFSTDKPFIVFTLGVILSTTLLVKNKILARKELIVLYGWIVVVILFFTFSSVVFSEYYIANLDVIFILIASLFLYLLYKNSKWGKILVLGLLMLLLTKNIFYFVSENIYQKGYDERKALAKYLTEDAKKRGFPCIAVSYLTKPGEDVGFRYFFWLNNLHVNQPISGSPIYTIVIPFELAVDSVKIKFGQFGVIPPENIPSKEEIERSCSGQNSNLTDPLFGFT